MAPPINLLLRQRLAQEYEQLQRKQREQEAAALQGQSAPARRVPSPDYASLARVARWAEEQARLPQPWPHQPAASTLYSLRQAAHYCTQSSGVRPPLEHLREQWRVVATYAVGGFEALEQMREVHYTRSQRFARFLRERDALAACWQHSTPELLPLLPAFSLLCFNNKPIYVLGKPQYRDVRALAACFNVGGTTALRTCAQYLAAIRPIEFQLGEWRSGQAVMDVCLDPPMVAVPAHLVDGDVSANFVGALVPQGAASLSQGGAAASLIAAPIVPTPSVGAQQPSAPGGVGSKPGSDEATEEAQIVQWLNTIVQGEGASGSDSPVSTGERASASPLSTFRAEPRCASPAPSDASTSDSVIAAQLLPRLQIRF